MAKPRISIQLYSLRSIEPLDTLYAAAAAAGYTTVEPFGGHFAKADELKALLARHKLAAPSCHVGVDALRADAGKVAKTARGLGIGLVLAPAPPPNERDLDSAGWRKLGGELARFGKTVNAEGLKFGWHNHHWEYAKTKQGDRGIDLLFAEAPDLLWEPDVAWIVRGGADPVAEIARYGSRVAAAHIKDIAPAGQCVDEDGWADVGHGTLPWPAIKAALAATTCDLLVVEHDKPSDPKRFATRSLAAMMKW